MKNCFIDTNIFLDVILKRKAFYQDSRKLLRAVEFSSGITGYISSSVITDIYFIVRKELSEKETRRHILTILENVDVADINIDLLRKALHSDFDDFEDAVQSFSAEQAGCDLIITRNKQDFAHSNLRVLTPTEFLKEITRE